ncbi:hydrolase [Mariniblastus sp.]|nr:hydrolase [Mariniblastus sp.]
MNSLLNESDWLQELDWLDKQSDAMLQLVENLANINSGTFNLDGLKTVADCLTTEFGKLDGDLSILESHPQHSINSAGKPEQRTLGNSIHISKRLSAKKKILLCIHMDTVYAKDHSFQKCQWLENGNLNGPGVADAKGGLIVMLYALLAFEKTPLAKHIGWEVLINPDEEIGSPGSVHLINEIAQRCSAGLLFEPALPDGTLVSWRKGSGNFTFVAKGRSAHSGREFEKGRNAIVAMAKLMEAIDQLNSTPEITYNIGNFKGGGALNVVPDLAIGRVNVRIKTVEQQNQVEQQFAELVRTANQSDGISIEMHGQFSSPPKPMSQDTAELQLRIEKCAEMLGKQINWRGTGGACDGNKFAAAGLPNIDTLGPRGGDIHSMDEYLIPESLVPSAKLVTLILLSFANEI